MTWYDVDDILYDGTKEQIGALVCPDCGGHISYSYDKDTGGMEVRCKSCGYLSRAFDGPEPNCASIFGVKHTL